MTGGLSQYARVAASIPMADISPEVAERFASLGEKIDAWGRQIDEVHAAHRADCLARYGQDIFEAPAFVEGSE